MRLRRLFIVFVLLLTGRFALGQQTSSPGCPVNIGFEKGTFDGWKAYIGSFPDTSGRQSIPWTSTTVPMDNAHTINVLPNTSPQSIDPYGNFPVNCPNGSGYSIQLGNSAVVRNYPTPGVVGGYAERVTYDFTIPNDDYTLICYYAVVLQDNGHRSEQQPKLIANVHNLDDPADDAAQCGKFGFIAGANPTFGFKRSDVTGGIDRSAIYYKPWSALVMKISGRADKRFQLEFIVNDCAPGGHFGYAYIDFNEGNCNSPITGNQYCINQDLITLTAPPGFETYKWTREGDTTILSSSPTLKIKQPFPPDGTKYNLSITPYDGLGCANAFTTSIQKLPDAFNLQVKSDPIQGCKSDGVDLTASYITAGSSPNLKYEYYTDPDGQNYLSDPKHVTEDGTYYIRGTNAGGCTDIAPLTVQLFNGPTLNIAAHPPICAPATYNLKSLVTSDPGAVVTYYTDVLLKTPVANPEAISKTGTYFIKSVSAGVPCTTVQAITLIISTPPADPDFDPTDPAKVYASCPPLNLNLAIGNTGRGDNSDGTFYTFYTDADGKNAISDPGKIMVGGLYYYRGTNIYGCDGPMAKVRVSVYPVPFFKVTDPDPVVFPQTVNLAYTHPPLTFATFSYWKDAACTQPLDDYQSIGVSGTYYIKSVNTSGCEVSVPVHVLVNAPPEADLVGPNTFTPNGDGVNDLFKPTTAGVVKVNYIKILNRYGSEVFYTTQLYTQWDGTYNGKPVPPGTYYWMFSAYDIYRKKQVMKSGKITLIR